MASGIAISRVALPELGIFTLQSPFWFRLHALTAEVTVGLVPVHVALRLEMDRRGRPPAAGPAPGGAVAVKFLRQFAAAAVVVAVVVLIGLAWSRLAPSLPGEGPADHAFVVQGQMVKLPPGVKPPPGGKLPPGAKLPRVRTPGIMRNNGSGIPSLLLGDLLKPVNLVVLRNNAFLEAVVIAAVVIIDAGYRRVSTLLFKQP